MAFPTTESNLVIDGIEFPPGSSRALSQTLDPIPQATVFRRTVSFNLVLVSPVAARKLKSVITCNDISMPTLTFPDGAIVTVDCIAERSYLTSGGSPEYDVVADSSRIDGEFTYYRPSIDMIVTGYNATHNEYGAQVGWTLSLEEA